MLTFFEYLRQRAFESVLTGAREALELLERQGYLDQPAERVSDQLKTISHDTAADAAVAPNPLDPQAGDPLSQPAGDAAKTKPPRQRETPKRKGTRQ